MLGRLFRNYYSGLHNLFGNEQLIYVIEGKGWSIDQDGLSITSSLNQQDLIKSRVTFSPMWAKNKIIHFGSVNAFLKMGYDRSIHPSNKIVLTWFHVLENDPRLDKVVEKQDIIDRIHTSCEITRSYLIAAGIRNEKIVVVPLGVDTQQFRAGSVQDREVIRNELGISQDRLVIGSFQKDGNGWGEGLEPKLVKGPDVFVETVARLKKHNPLVLLVGPARGYVKQELNKLGIEYKHVQFEKFEDVARMYHALDLCIIASRIEGGPKAILEAWASGVPMVSTKVGMVPDIGTDNKNVLLAEVEDVERLAGLSDDVLSNQDLRKQLILRGLDAVRKYSWDKIAQRYYDEIYSKL